MLLCKRHNRNFLGCYLDPYHMFLKPFTSNLSSLNLFSGSFSGVLSFSTQRWVLSAMHWLLTVHPSCAGNALYTYFSMVFNMLTYSLVWLFFTCMSLYYICIWCVVATYDRRECWNWSYRQLQTIVLCWEFNQCPLEEQWVL